MEKKIIVKRKYIPLQFYIIYIYTLIKTKANAEAVCEHLRMIQQIVE